MKQKNLKAPKGMHDILPKDQKYWLKVSNDFSKLAQSFGFNFIETPVLEEKDLFYKSLGEMSEVVTEKEMYELRTKGGDEFVLRPEMTAGIARAYIENGLFSLPQPLKLFSIGPVFRHEKPQAGRYREFHQANLEVMGENDAVLDAQIIQIFHIFLSGLGLDDLNIQINSIGCYNCRPDYHRSLKEYLKEHQNKLCGDCWESYQKDSLRFSFVHGKLQECEQEKCQQVAARIAQQVDYLCKECHNHFRNVLEYLDELKIPYFLNFSLTRGLDYYTKTVFEFWPESEIGKAKPLSLASGGRYDKLIEQLGGRDIPAVGGAAGLERVIEYMKNKDVLVLEENEPQVFLVQLGELGKKKSLQLFQDFREAGIRIVESFGRSNIQTQLRAADRLNVPWAIILGQKEAFDGTVIIRDMDSGMQETVPASKVINEVRKRLRKPKTKIKIKKPRYNLLSRFLEK